MIEMEVRCCCNPKKLLGWLPIERITNRVNFVIHEMDLKWVDVDSDIMPEPTVTMVSLPIETFIDPKSGEPPHFALKSEETPIETLRKIRGFIEAK